MKKMKINEFEYGEMYENAMLSLEDFIDEYTLEHNRKPTQKQKDKFIADFIKKDYLEKHPVVRQGEKEQEQVECVFNALPLSVEEMSALLKRKGYVRGSSVKTIYRRILPDLEKLGVEKNSEGKYFYPQKVKNKNEEPEGVISSRMDNMVIISNFLETIKDSPVYETAKKFIENEIGHIRYSYKDFSLKSFSRIIFLGAPASVMPDSIWSDIYTAMEGNYHISIKYLSHGSTEVKSHGVKPYQLIFDNGIWDLWGYDCKAREERLFNLSRIQSVEIRKDSDRFEYSEDFDFRNVTPGTFGCFKDRDDKMTFYKIRLAKGSYAESYARERVWGLNYSMKSDEDGTVISFEDNQFEPILRWVLGWGPDAEPLEPPTLVAQWKEKIKKMSVKA